jgi:diacylglycerol kinase (ATP)
MRGTQSTQEPIRTGRARKVLVTAVEGVLPAHADGETLCIDGQQLELELLPRQIEVITTGPSRKLSPGGEDAA